MSALSLGRWQSRKKRVRNKNLKKQETGNRKKRKKERREREKKIVAVKERAADAAYLLERGSYRNQLE